MHFHVSHAFILLIQLKRPPVKPALFILLFIFSNHSFSETNANKKAQPRCKQLTVVGSDQWVPFAYLESEEANIPKGISFDVVRLISEDLNISLTFKIGIPWRRLELLMDGGQVDVLAGNYWNEHRAKKWAITRAISKDEVRVFVLSKKTLHFKTLTDLIGFEGLIPSGVSFGQAFDGFKPNLSLDEVTTHEQMITMLTLKRSDYLVLPYFNGLRKLNRLGLNEQIIALETPLTINPVHLSLAKKSPCYSDQLLEQFNQAIDERLSDGSIRKIEQSYLNAN